MRYSFCYVVHVGKFSARVRASSEEKDPWVHVWGPHGPSQMNEAGRGYLIKFLLLNKATIWNSWFEKKTVHEQTWQHPKVKILAPHWLCCSLAERAMKVLGYLCKRGMECHTDHLIIVRFYLSESTVVLFIRDGSGSKWPPVLKVWEQLCDKTGKKLLLYYY